jgi:hypothetical protein
MKRRRKPARGTSGFLGFVWRTNCSKPYNAASWVRLQEPARQPKSEPKRTQFSCDYFQQPNPEKLGSFPSPAILRPGAVYIFSFQISFGHWSSTDLPSDIVAAHRAVLRDPERKACGFNGRWFFGGVNGFIHRPLAAGFPAGRPRFCGSACDAVTSVNHFGGRPGPRAFPASRRAIARMLWLIMSNSSRS